MRNIHIIDNDAFLNAISKTNCNQFGELRSNSFFVRAYSINPPPDYEKPDNFPACCNYHSKLFSSIIEWHNKFPNCCVYHKKLVGQPWFNKSDYDYLVDKIINQIHYTERQIELYWSNENWLDFITEYIEYNVYSFGQLPDGFGSPVGLDKYIDNIINYVKHTKIEIQPFARKKIIEYLNSFEVKKSNNKTDLNLLADTYRKWLKIFPFQLDSTGQLKTYFSNRLPLLTSPIITNRYMGTAKAKLISPELLVSQLFENTKQLINKIANDIYSSNNDELPPLETAKQIVIEHHRIKQEKLLGEFSKHELKYIGVLKKWLKNETEFFNNIKLFESNNCIGKPFEIEYAIQHISSFYIELFKHKGNFSNTSEPELRTLLLAHLSSAFQNCTVTGESTNGSGKTDFLIKHESGENYLIGECKFWKCDAEYKKAINQLLGYVSTSDNDAALVFFVRGQSFDTIVKKVVPNTTKHIDFISQTKHNLKKNIYSFIMKNQFCNDRTVNLKIMFFHIPAY